MDPHTGKVYDESEIPSLPVDIRERLVPYKPPRAVKRNKRKTQKGKTYDLPSRALVDKRRAASKRAKQARKKNR